MLNRINRYQVLGLSATMQPPCIHLETIKDSLKTKNEWTHFLMTSESMEIFLNPENEDFLIDGMQ